MHIFPKTILRKTKNKKYTVITKQHMKSSSLFIKWKNIFYYIMVEKYDLYKVRAFIYSIFGVLLSYNTMGKYHVWIPLSIRIIPPPFGRNDPHCVRFPSENILLNISQ